MDNKDTKTPYSLATEKSLPFWRTVGQAYIIWARNLAEVIRISWLWLLLMTPVLFAIIWFVSPYLFEVMQAASAGGVMPRPSGFVLLVQAIETLVMLPMVASIAVAWHRLVLRDEHVTERAYLRLDRVVLVYAALLLLVRLLYTLPSYLNDMFAGTATDAETMSWLLPTLLIFLLMIVGFYVVARLSVILPALALEHDDITLGRVWKETRGNGWKLFWGYILCTIPIFAVASAGGWWLLTLNESRFVFAFGSVLFTYISSLSMLIAVGFLSLTYRYLLEE
jgi:membrane-anchored glycerophosphoryl diester phosphodiesterase (GDPDase)